MNQVPENQTFDISGLQVLFKYMCKLCCAVMAKRLLMPCKFFGQPNQGFSAACPEEENVP